MSRIWWPASLKSEPRRTLHRPRIFALRRRNNNETNERLTKYDGSESLLADRKHICALQESRGAEPEGNAMSLAYRFFTIGIVFALIGMGLGTYMGITQNFIYAPVHAHINLVGWATHFLFGLYYRGEPANAKGILPEAHFLCAIIGGILLPIGVIGAVTNDPTLDIAVIPGTLFTIISMALFLAVVLRGWRREEASAARPVLVAR
jgi:FtsH-binding integral membrane protein